VDGHGKEQSRNLADAVTELTTRLRTQPGVAVVLPQVTTDSRGAFSFNLKLDTSVVPVTPGEDEAAADEADAADGAAGEGQH